jgi:hypothetical protein
MEFAVVRDKKTGKPFGMGGFYGIPNTVMAAGDSRKRTSRAPPDGAALYEERSHEVRMAQVPFDGWEREKEKRVAVAFGRVIEREWADRREQDLKACERVHINAVREHYAMRRDKLKTPDVRARRGGNTLSQEEWAANVEAIDVLQGGTGIQTFFRGMVGKQIKERKMRDGEIPDDRPRRKKQAAKPDMQF